MGTQDGSVLFLQHVVNLYLAQNESLKKADTKKYTLYTPFTFNSRTAELICDERDQKMFPLVGRGVGEWGQPARGGRKVLRNLLHLDRGVDYTAVCFCQNSSNISYLSISLYCNNLYTSSKAIRNYMASSAAFYSSKIFKRNALKIFVSV